MLSYPRRRFIISVAVYTSQFVHTIIFAWPTCPYGHFLFTDLAHTGQLVHTDIFFTLLKPAWAIDYLFFLNNQREIQLSL